MDVSTLNPGDIVRTTKYNGLGLMLIQRIQCDVEAQFDLAMGRRWLLAGHVGVARMTATAHEIIEKIDRSE